MCQGREESSSQKDSGPNSGSRQLCSFQKADVQKECGAESVGNEAHG